MSSRHDIKEERSVDIMLNTIIACIVSIVIVLIGLTLVGTGAAFILTVLMTCFCFKDEKEMEDEK